MGPDEQQSVRRKRGLLRRLGKVTGPRPSWHGAAVLLAITSAAVIGWNLLDKYLPGLGLVLATQTAINVLVAFALSGVVIGLLFVTAGRFKALPWSYLWTLGTCLILLITLEGGASPTGWFVTVAVLVTGSSLLGGALGALLPPAAGRPMKVRDRRTLILALALVLLVAPTSWLLTASHTAPEQVDVGAPATELERDPASSGPFEVATLTYGSGTDQRDAYGHEVDLETPPVDGSDVITGWDERRESLWGFDVEHLPLNGRVWYPRGDGPFPLVLIAHGNKSNATASEAGFQYLGELLAGHGFITVSVDQNFLNTRPLDRSGGLGGVDVARGWMLLEHLRVWDAWNRGTAGNNTPFAGRVDMDAIGLIGHSRGGEAIAVAAHLAGLDRLPGDDTAGGDTVALDYDFDIGALLALAPSDGQYLPDGSPIRLEDVDYLVIQGSHDADIAGFDGLNQYERVTFTGDRPSLKAALSIGRANHSHFNSRWGDHDVGYGVPKLFLDTDALIAPQDQRRVTEVYASAFLRATLADNRADTDLLRDYRAGSAFLPDGEYVGQFAESATVRVDESSLVAEGFATSEVIDLPLRNGSGADRVWSLGWEQGGGQGPTLTAEVPSEASDGSGASDRPPEYVVFDAIARTTWSEDAELADAVSVRLTDGSDRSAELPLADVMPLRHLVSGQYLKARWMHRGAVTEPILQTYTLPLDAFGAVEPDLDRTDLRTIALVFDNTVAGSVLVDDVGLTPPGTP